jgi:hypothetical protein
LNQCAAPPVRACLVVGDVEKTSARINALDAEIDARLRGHISGGRGRAVKQGSCGFEAPDPILATLGDRGLDRLMFEYYVAGSHQDDRLQVSSLSSSYRYLSVLVVMFAPWCEGGV